MLCLGNVSTIVSSYSVRFCRNICCSLSMFLRNYNAECDFVSKHLFRFVKMKVFCNKSSNEIHNSICSNRWIPYRAQLTVIYFNLLDNSKLFTACVAQCIYTILHSTNLISSFWLHSEQTYKQNLWALLSSSGSRPCPGQLHKTTMSKETLSHSQVSRSEPGDWLYNW